MDGIWTVMECIAQGVSDEWHDKFDKEFVQNMIASEEKAKIEPIEKKVTKEVFDSRTGNKTKD